MDLIHPSFPGAGGAMERPANVFGVGDVARQRRPVLALPAQRLLERVPVKNTTITIAINLEASDIPNKADTVP